MGRLFTFDNFLKITERVQTYLAIFPQNKSYVASSTKRVGLHFTYICIKNKIKIPSCHTTIYQNFPFQGPPKKFLIWDCIVCKKIIWQPWA
jgi:hypothetical protein